MHPVLQQLLAEFSKGNGNGQQTIAEETMSMATQELALMAILSLRVLTNDGVHKITQMALHAQVSVLLDTPEFRQAVVDEILTMTEDNPGIIGLT